MGIPIDKTSFIFVLSGFMSFFDILKFLGINKKRIKIDVSSLIILTSTTKAMANSKLFLSIIGKPIIKTISLTKSSITLERTWGIIFCFPKK